MQAMLEAFVQSGPSAPIAGLPVMSELLKRMADLDEEEAEAICTLGTPVQQVCLLPLVHQRTPACENLSSHWYHSTLLHMELSDIKWQAAVGMAPGEASALMKRMAWLKSQAKALTILSAGAALCGGGGALVARRLRRAAEAGQPCAQADCFAAEPLWQHQAGRALRC